jgi:hypothetical protein
MSILFSATYPGRTTALILVGCYAARIPSPDYPGRRTRRLGRERSKIPSVPGWTPP